MTTNVLIYTVATDINEERLFVKLDAVCVEGCVFHLLGTDKTNEPFVAWATVNDHNFQVHKIDEDKYGYSALQRVTKRIFLDNNIDKLLVHEINASTLDLTHLARDKDIKIVVF